LLIFFLADCHDFASFYSCSPSRYHAYYYIDPTNIITGTGLKYSLGSLPDPDDDCDTENDEAPNQSNLAGAIFPINDDIKVRIERCSCDTALCNGGFSMAVPSLAVMAVGTLIYQLL